MMTLSTDSLPQVECNPLLGEFPIVPETVKSNKKKKKKKKKKNCHLAILHDQNAISAEIYKAGGPPTAEKLTELFHIMCRKEAIPLEFKDASIIHLFKRKGNPRLTIIGASLFSIAGHMLARVLLNRLNEHLEQSGLLPESVIQEGQKNN